MKMNRKEQVEALKKVVGRNKLKENGESIDKMVSFLKAEGINAVYCPKI